MYQPKKWWIGLLPLLVLWLATLWFKTDDIESDIAQRAAAQIASENANAAASGWAQVAVAGRDVTITGRAPAEGLQARTADAAEQAFGVRLVHGAASLLDEQKPFTWSAMRDGSTLTLSGFVAPDDSREKIIAAAKAAFPGLTINDQMKAARGSPAAAAAMAAYGLGQLSKLENGSASLSDMAFSISGAAPTPELYATTLASLKSLPGSMSLGKADIAPPTIKPFVWSAARNGNELTLSGFVPSEAIRTSLVDAAKQAISGATVIDKMQIALGAPQNFAEAALAAIGQLSHLAEGTISVSDLALSFTGRSTDASFNTASLTDALRGKLPAGFMPQISIEAPPPPPPPPVPVAAPPPPPPAPVLPTARPFVWSAAKTIDALTVTGFAPSDAALKNSVAAVKAIGTGLKFTDELRVAQGLPDGVDFDAAAKFVAAQLSGMRIGAARITDNRLSVSGEAPNLQVYRAATAALDGALPGGLVKDQVNLAIAPYQWGLTASATTTVLSGFVPDERTRQDILAAAAKAFPNARIIDQLAVAGGAPSCFAAMTSAVIATAGKLENPAALFDGAMLKLRGATEAKSVADEVAAMTAAGWPGCARGSADVTVKAAVTVDLPAPPPVPEAQSVMPKTPPPANPATSAPAIPPAGPSPSANASQPSQTQAAECTTMIRTALQKDLILFAKNKADIQSESRNVLGDVARLLGTCPSARFEVAAHTDSDGDPGYNMDLSQRRAAAVVEFLSGRLSVPVDRLVAKGYGETKPVAPNTTSDGKRQNRRVEFNLVN